MNIKSIFMKLISKLNEKISDFIAYLIIDNAFQTKPYYLKDRIRLKIYSRKIFNKNKAIKKKD